MKLENQTVLITSNEPWGEIWFSKQHYAVELAQIGHAVFFINSPANWRPWHLFSFSVRSNEINENLTVLNYSNNFPLKIFKRFSLKLNDFLNSWKISHAVKTKEVVWWQFDPFRFIDVHFFPDIKRIYHVVDPFQHIWSDKAVAKRADLVVSVSNYYKEHYLNLNPSFLYVPHGISTNERKPNANLSEKIKNALGDNYIVFVGTINIDVDIQLLNELALTLKQYELLLIGPIAIQGADTKAFQNLCSLPNVKYIDCIPALELYNYLAPAKAGIVPYKRKRTENVHRTPLKIMNYLENKIPVVTTLNYELTELNNKSIFVADSNKEFIETVNKIMSGEIRVEPEIFTQYTEKVIYPFLIQKIFQHLYA